MTSKSRNRPNSRPAATRRTRKRDGRVTLTTKNQVTIPAQVVRELGLTPGAKLQASADDDGRIVLEPVDDIVARFAGSCTGMFDRAELERLRDEWDR